MDSRFEKILQRIPEAEREKLSQVYAYSAEHLSSVRRRNGIDYSTHGLEVASVFSECSNDASIISVAFLHDILLHPQGEHLLSGAPLTQKEKNSVRIMNRLRRLHIDSNKMDLNRFIEAISEESYLIPLRIAHRLNDIRSLSLFDDELKEKMAHESLHMYAAIAGRLSMHSWRYEMEDICFRFLQKETVTGLLGKFEEYKKLDQISFSHAVKYIGKKLDEAGIHHRIDYRLKSLYSTYRKMIVKNRKFEDMTDRLAVRIITKNTEDCYRALGIVHAHMHPIAGKLKDYIGIPKENGYQSIHTVVYPLPGVTEQPIEIQIRTEEMHKACEYGVAAHGEYKNANYSLRTNYSHVNLIKNFQLLCAKGRSPEQFENTLRTYFDENHMAIFDSDNNLYHVKRPANILDFMCLLYPKKLANLKEVRLNGRVVPIDTALHDGDIVDPRFTKKPTINISWIKACVRDENAKRIKGIFVDTYGDKR